MSATASKFLRGFSSLSASGFQTTCDSDGSVDGGSLVHQQWTSSSSSASASADRFLDNGSTPTLTAESGAFKHHRVSEVDNLDLSEYNCEETTKEKNIRLKKQAKKEYLAAEKEQTRAEHGDFFVEDGECEEEETNGMTFPLSRPLLKRTPTLKSGNNQFDDEYDEEEDFDLLRFNVVKKADQVAEELRLQKKLDDKAAAKVAKVAVKAERLAEIVKSENPFELPEAKFTHCGLRKKTKGDFAVSYTEEIEVFVHNKLYSQVLNAEGATQCLVAKTSEEVQATNKELDASFISFLVKHTVTMVGSEIALERCIVDYVLKKQSVNDLSVLEQQEISNWKAIFIKIENIISSQVRDENNARKDLLDAALSNTITLSENNFRKLRNEVALDQSISGQEQTEAIYKLRKDADATNAKAKALTSHLKALLDATLKTTNQKINSTIHYIAMKVCVYWANINNCVDIISPDLVASYTTRFLKHDFLAAQLSSAESTGRLLMNAPMCEDQPVAVDDLTCALAVEESELRVIMKKDHAKELMGVILSVKAKVEDIVALVDILWTKGPRTKLSTAVAVKKEGGEEKKSKKITTTETAVKSASVIDVSAGSPTVVSTPTPAAGWTQTTLANTDGKLGLSLTGYVRVSF
jgi:hypothetical protein